MKVWYLFCARTGLGLLPLFFVSVSVVVVEGVVEDDGRKQL